MKNELLNVSERSEEVQSIMGVIPPWIIRWGVMVVGLIVLIMLIGSYFFRYPEKISARIQLTTTNPPAELRARADGHFDVLLVHNRMKVKSGQLLGIIENTANYKDVLYIEALIKKWCNDHRNNRELSVKLNNSSFLLGELESSFSSFKRSLDESIMYYDLRYYPQKIALRNRQLQQQKMMFDIWEKGTLINKMIHKASQRIYHRDSILYSQKVITGEEYDNAEQIFWHSRQSLVSDEKNCQQEKIQRVQNEETLLDLENQQIQTENSTKTSVDISSKALLSAIESWKKKYCIVSPCAGYVNMLGIWNPHQYVSSGSSIMSIIPLRQSKSIGKALIAAAGAGKVKVGQKVLTRLENYPEGEFGFIIGRVNCISDLPNEKGYYVVDVSYPHGLLTNYKKRLPNSKILVGNAEIIVKNKRLIENFVQPIESLLKRNEDY